MFAQYCYLIHSLYFKCYLYSNVFIGFFLPDQDLIQDQAIACSCHVSLASLSLEKFLSLS